MKKINEIFDFDSSYDENEFERGIEDQVTSNKEFARLNMIGTALFRHFNSREDNHVLSFNYTINTLTGGRFRLNCSDVMDDEYEMIIKASNNKVWKTPYKEMIILEKVDYHNVHKVSLDTIWKDFILSMKKDEKFKNEFMDSIKYCIIPL